MRNHENEWPASVSVSDFHSVEERGQCARSYISGGGGLLMEVGICLCVLLVSCLKVCKESLERGGVTVW